MHPDTMIQVLQKWKLRLQYGKHTPVHLGIERPILERIDRIVVHWEGNAIGWGQNASSNSNHQLTCNLTKVPTVDFAIGIRES